MSKYCWSVAQHLKLLSLPTALGTHLELRHLGHLTGVGLPFSASITSKHGLATTVGNIPAHEDRCGSWHADRSPRCMCGELRHQPPRKASRGIAQPASWPFMEDIGLHNRGAAASVMLSPPIILHPLASMTRHRGARGDMVRLRPQNQSRDEPRWLLIEQLQPPAISFGSGTHDRQPQSEAT